MCCFLITRQESRDGGHFAERTVLGLSHYWLENTIENTGECSCERKTEIDSKGFGPIRRMICWKQNVQYNCRGHAKTNMKMGNKQKGSSKRTMGPSQKWDGGCRELNTSVKVPVKAVKPHQVAEGGGSNHTDHLGCCLC